MTSSISVSLHRSLRSLGRDLPRLDALLIPGSSTVPANGGGHASPGPRAPLSIALLDLKHDVERSLESWLRAALSASGQGYCVTEDIKQVVEMMQELAFVIERQPWGRRCGDEIAGLAALVADVVSPRDGQVHMPVEVGGVREIAAWARRLGRKVSVPTLYRWVAEGRVPAEITPDGRTLVRLADVLEKCHDLRAGE